jgi:GTP-binding protein
VTIGGRPWRFVDTAGIRRRVHQADGADFYASLRTQAALEKAEVAVVLFDSSEPLTEQDTRVVQMVVDAGRALVIAYNKWDLVDEERRRYLEREFEQDLVQVQWAPRVNISAMTRRHVDRLVPALDTSLASWETPRILYGTQASARPPRFVLFTTGFLEAGYRRFVERRLRETFGFVGTPIEVSVRPREKRRR